MSEKQEKAGLFTRIFSNKKTSYIFSLVLSVVLAFIICAFILLVAGYDPIQAYGAMVTGAFDSLRHIGDVLEYAMVLCICGLACVLGARVGIFNVGGEGQLLLGAIFAAQVGIWLDGSSKWIVIPLAAIAAMLASRLCLHPGLAQGQAEGRRGHHHHYDEHHRRVPLQLPRQRSMEELQ